MQSMGNDLRLCSCCQEEMGEERHGRSWTWCHLQHQHCAMNTPLPPPLEQPDLGQPYTHIHVMHIMICYISSACACATNTQGMVQRKLFCTFSAHGDNYMPPPCTLIVVRSCNNLIKSMADRGCCVAACAVHGTHFSMSWPWS